MSRRERLGWENPPPNTPIERLIGIINTRLGQIGRAMVGTIVRKNTGTTDYERTRLNLIEGAGVTLTVTDDPTNDEIDITITAGAGAIGDGDKGDITVSGGGTVWTVDAEVYGQSILASQIFGT